MGWMAPASMPESRPPPCSACLDEADAGNDAAAGHGLVGVGHVVQKARQRAQRQPGRAAVQQQRHALARQQLMALGKARAGLGRSAAARSSRARRRSMRASIAARRSMACGDAAFQLD
jgi:hypothetical protein